MPWPDYIGVVSPKNAGLGLEALIRLDAMGARPDLRSSSRRDNNDSIIVCQRRKGIDVMMVIFSVSVPYSVVAWVILSEQQRNQGRTVTPPVLSFAHNGCRS